MTPQRTFTAVVEQHVRYTFEVEAESHTAATVKAYTMVSSGVWPDTDNEVVSDRVYVEQPGRQAEADYSLRDGPDHNDPESIEYERARREDIS